MYLLMCFSFWKEEEKKSLGRTPILVLSIIHISISVYQFVLGVSVRILLESFEGANQMLSTGELSNT